MPQQPSADSHNHDAADPSPPPPHDPKTAESESQSDVARPLRGLQLLPQSSSGPNLLNPTPPISTTEDADLKASSGKREPSLGPEEHDGTSTATSAPLLSSTSRQPQQNGDVDAVGAAAETKEQNEDTSATPLEPLSRDTTVTEGQQQGLNLDGSVGPHRDPVSTIASTASPLARTTSQTLSIDTNPSSITRIPSGGSSYIPSGSSYIPPPRPRPQAAPLPPTQLEDTSSQFTHRAANMFRLTTPAHRRRNMANTNALTNYEADLTSRDRAKQKEAVRRFLDDKVEEEWKWQWPRPSNAKDGFVDHMKNTNREAVCWKERDEWLSNTNDTDDEPTMPTAASPDTASPAGSFKFESPDDVGDVIKRRQLEKKRRRERKLQDELAYNEGLQCFTARRDAWTGARRVPRDSDLTHTSSRTLSSVINNPESSTSADETQESDSSDLDLAIEIPVAPPLLPPTNAMRAAITPAAYTTIYEKVILQQTTPSSPINLQDLISSCVQGWKRDGEWPPKSTIVDSVSSNKLAAAHKKKGRKMSIASIFGSSRIAREIAMADDEREKEGEGGLKRGLQKILGLRRESISSSANGVGGHGHGHGRGNNVGNGSAVGNVNGNGNGNNGNGNGHAADGHAHGGK